MAQHNYPEPSDFELDEFNKMLARKESMVYKIQQRFSWKKETETEPDNVEFPIRRHNRNKEMIWEQLPQL